MSDERLPYLADRFEWAAPGDQQQDCWIVRFCDKDMREAIFEGPDAEVQAWDAWERYAPTWNCYVFRLARLQNLTTEIAALKERLREAGEVIANQSRYAEEAVVYGQVMGASHWREALASIAKRARAFLQENPDG